MKQTIQSGQQLGKKRQEVQMMNFSKQTSIEAFDQSRWRTFGTFGLTRLTTTLVIAGLMLSGCASMTASEDERAAMAAVDRIERQQAKLERIADPHFEGRNP